MSSVFPLCSPLLLLGVRSRISECLLSTLTTSLTLYTLASHPSRFYPKEQQGQIDSNWRKIEAVVHIGSVGIIQCVWLWCLFTTGSLDILWVKLLLLCAWNDFYTWPHQESSPHHIHTLNHMLAGISEAKLRLSITAPNLRTKKLL